VNDVENKGRARPSSKRRTTVAKAGAYLSFWTFMSLLFGAVAATLAGVLGGELRDGEASAGSARDPTLMQNSKS